MSNWIFRRIMCCAWSFSFGKWLLFHVGKSLRLGMMIVTEEKFSNSFHSSHSRLVQSFSALGSSKMNLNMLLYAIFFVSFSAIKPWFVFSQEHLLRLVLRSRNNGVPEVGGGRGKEDRFVKDRFRLQGF